MSGLRPAGTVLVLILLAGCGTLNRSGPTGGADDLASYYRYAAALDKATLTGEYRNFRNWVTGSRCTPDRLRLAILTLVAESGPASKADPSVVLGPCLGGSERPPPRLRNMAFLLEDQIRKRRDLAKHAHELRSRVNHLEGSLSEQRKARQELTEKKGELEKRLKTLQEQLEALKDIERSIQQRD
ncbi:hypothetical protein [Thiohalorhabdus methylotrophus]|uniref:Lipoprotein n=1 Tax=Thiohalorhabdus methylotrophus TaxID=3242694 RepID=A0ABV4TXI1_9GAMM